jgi:phosphoglycolate phosphatase-like HAD superfamily hydrolase
VYQQWLSQSGADMIISDIFWDFDGTLVDTYPPIGRAFNTALAQWEQTAPLEEVIELGSISLGHCLTHLSERFAILLPDLEAAFWPVYQQIRPDDQAPFPEVIAVCAAVQARGHRNFIVTHRRRPSLMALLEAHAMTSLFTDILAGDDGFARKPDPGAFLHLIHKHAIDTHTALVIGDRDLDVQAAERAELRACLFRSVFANCSPHYHISAYRELLALLGS